MPIAKTFDAAVDAFPANVLGRHVSELAAERAFARGALDREQRLREAEVCDACDAVESDEDVRGRDVTMNEPEVGAVVAFELVYGAQACACIEHDTDRDRLRSCRRLLRPAANQLAERCALDVVHDELNAALVDLDIANVDDVRVMKPRRDSSPLRRAPRRTPDRPRGAHEAA